MKRRNSSKVCVCWSGKLSKECCDPLLGRLKKAKTAVQLMRSRYSAYALGGHGEYLFDTWLPEKRMDLSVVELSLRQLNWVRLEVLKGTQSGEFATVEFVAYFVDAEGGEQAHRELSSFKRVSGDWYYVGD
jgi:SEC-C motif-containing protein